MNIVNAGKAVANDWEGRGRGPRYGGRVNSLKLYAGALMSFALTRPAAREPRPCFYYIHGISVIHVP